MQQQRLTAASFGSKMVKIETKNRFYSSLADVEIKQSIKGQEWKSCTSQSQPSNKLSIGEEVPSQSI